MNRLKAKTIIYHRGTECTEKNFLLFAAPAAQLTKNLCALCASVVKKSFNSL